MCIISQKVSYVILHLLDVQVLVQWSVRVFVVCRLEKHLQAAQLKLKPLKAARNESRPCKRLEGFLNMSGSSIQ